MNGDIAERLSDGVLQLVLDRADKRNALTEHMYLRLADRLEAANADGQVRAILIAGRGEHFCAGNDAAEAVALGRGEIAGESQSWRMIRALVNCEVPMVAAVQGYAVGIGVTLLLHCDAVFLTPNATLRTPFVKLGLVPEAVSSLLLPQLVGHVRAFSLFGLGRPISAQTAVDWGLANAVVPDLGLHEAGLAAASAIANAPAPAVRHTKRLMRDRPAMLERAAEEGSITAELLASPATQAAFSEFLVKRPRSMTGEAAVEMD